MPGTTKTRLIPLLGRYNAADLQRRFTEMTVGKAKKVRQKKRLDIQFCFEGGNEHKLKSWLGKDILYSSQENADLGTRMQVAFEMAFQEGCQHVLLLGTDIPGFHADHLRNAFEALDHYDVVLGPSTDGGYWLIGLKRPINLFKDVVWSTKKVREQTLSIAQARSLEVFEFKALTDIDTIDDLKKWDESAIIPGPYISIIIPTLNEEDNIQKTIENVRDEEVEIIVVDGGSQDRTVDLARKAGVDVINSQTNIVE